MGRRHSNKCPHQDQFKHSNWSRKVIPQTKVYISLKYIFKATICVVNDQGYRIFEIFGSKHILCSIIPWDWVCAMGLAKTKGLRGKQTNKQNKSKNTAWEWFWRQYTMNCIYTVFCLIIYLRLHLLIKVWYSKLLNLIKVWNFWSTWLFENSVPRWLQGFHSPGCVNVFSD